MATISKLDQALRDLIEAYAELEQELEEKCGEDEEAFGAAVIEALETSIESAIEDQESSSGFVAAVLSSLSEALEQIDPSAFEGEEGEEDEEEEYEMEDDDDADYDEDDEDEAEEEEEDE